MNTPAQCGAIKPRKQTFTQKHLPNATASTRVSRRCNRTRIESEAIGALLDRGSLNHRFQQGLDPYSGTLNHPAPHVPAQPRMLR